MPFPARDLYWAQKLPPRPVATVQARIPQSGYRERLDLYPLGYSPPGLGYGAFFLPAGWGLWNYNNGYVPLYTDTQPATEGAH
jgi:hypothetical protein